MDAMMRLVNLSAEVDALRNKTELNRRMAKEATAQAANATQVASSLQQVSVGGAGGPFFFPPAALLIQLNVCCCFLNPPDSQRHGEAVHQAAGEDRLSGGRRSQRHQQEGHGHQEGSRRSPQQSHQGD